MKKIILLILIILITSTNINAVRYVNYNFYEGVILDNGNLMKTTIPITNVKVVGFTCLDLKCENLGNNIFGNILESNNNPNIQLAYPSDLQTQYGYAIYFYKDNYIPWEMNSNWYGDDQTDPQGPYNIYLTKKESCNSFIGNLSSYNSVNDYLPLTTFSNANSGILTTPGIINSGPLEAIPSEVQNSYFIKQLVKFKVFDNLNNLISEQVKEYFVKYGENKGLDFNFTPTLKGKHKIVLSSKVIDNKCISSPEIISSKEITVFENYNNLCYTTLNNIKLNKFKFKSGDTIIITGNKISNLL